MVPLRRYHEDNRPYFVTAVVKGRRPIFRDPSIASLLRSVLLSSRERYGYLLLAFSIMPDHLHAIIVPAEGDTISAVMRYVKGKFARSYNERCSTTGAVWQRRFYDVGIRSEAELASRVRYVEQNPVEAGLVEHPGEYPFSSAAPRAVSDLDRYLE